MPLTIAAYDAHVEQLRDTVRRLADALGQAGIEYRVIGGLAVFFHVHDRDPGAARSTRDVDLAVDRAQLATIIEAVRPLGLAYRHAAGIDMLIDATEPRARSAVHLVFVREKVRPEYLEAIPDFSPPARTTEGVLVAPVADLVRMKLTSYRLKDRVHIQDMDAVGLITPEIEARLPDVLRARLREVRAAE
ncbi:MAG: hypothetical protein HYR51_08750 [Candidatus Rokubacteria bacterium]|nr:hypothetical protein [Candidatus Rokubacteria bacterium]